MFNRKESSFVENLQDNKKWTMIKELIVIHYNLSNNSEDFLNKMEEIRKNSFLDSKKFNALINDVLDEKLQNSIPNTYKIK